MSDSPGEEGAPALRTRTAEVATALVLAAIGALAIWDASRLGLGWGEEGPKSGTFPFWIGLFLVLASLGTLVGAVRAGGAAAFVSRPQLRRVASVLLPTVVYVAGIGVLGLYVASALLVIWFMLVLGGFRVRAAIPAGLAVALVVFVVFEQWFLVALPKGPLEEWLGY